MLMARSAPPTMRTSPTPVERSKRGLTNLSASSVSSRIGRSAESAIVMTGDWSLSNLPIVGGRTSGGRSRSTVATRSRTSWAAASMSRSRSNEMITNELPDCEIERSWSMPSTVLTASSMRSLTRVSISSVDAPGSAVRTLTVGRSNEGKRSTGKRIRPARPSTTSVAISIDANTGRRMKVSISARTAAPSGLDADRRAVLQAARREHDDLARLQALLHLDALACLAADLDAALDRDAVLDHEDLVDAGEAH